jgi:hypothetical protein
MRARQVIPPVIAGMSLAALSGAMVAGIWRVGDERCVKATKKEVLAGYGYPITYSPCDEQAYAGWMQPALR